MALQSVERARLLDGNWKIRPAAGLYFNRSWCEVVDAAPAGLQTVRGWDLAGTPETGQNDPDWTCSCKMARHGSQADGWTYYVLDATWLRGTPQKVQEQVLNLASHDGRGVAISLPQDPAQAGKSQAIDFVRRLAGYKVSTTVEARNTSANPTPAGQSAKITRFSPFSAQAEPGNVKVLRGFWNARWFDELEAFPEAKHDDQPDATSRAFNALIGTTGGVRTQRSIL